VNRSEIISFLNVFRLSFIENVFERYFNMGKMLPEKFTKQIKTLSVVCLMLALATGNATATKNLLSKPDLLTSENTQKKTIRIGLLIPDEDRLPAKHGAQLAIQKANKNGGFTGIPYELIVKPTSGPWGTSSKKSVSLVFDDEVMVIMGSLSSRDAHLAEQVAAKTKLVYLSSRATDMSLSNAYVPWYFRVVPNDKQQAAALIEEIFFNKKLKKVALIGTDQSDSELAVRAFIEEAKIKGAEQPTQFKISTSKKKSFKIPPDFNIKNFEAIVLIGSENFASVIIPFIKRNHAGVPLFATLSVTDNQKAINTNWKLLENITLVASDFWFTKKGMTFQEEFQEEFGYKPGPAAAYAFDGMNVIIEAVKMAEPTLTDVIDDREKIIDAFSTINYKNGITGDIEFDNNGNRINSVKLMRIKNGKPVHKHVSNEE